MTQEQFIYWLQGFAELHPETPTQEQWDSIRQHLQQLFIKVTPPLGREEKPFTPWPAMERPYVPAGPSDLPWQADPNAHRPTIIC